MSRPAVESRPSLIHGAGLFALRSFAPGEKIADYVGRPTRTTPRYSPGDPVYALEIGPGLWLDGDSPDNQARHANHSCRPNAELIHETESNETRLVAREQISQGEEITFDYGFSLAESLFHPCRCGQPGCVGRIIASPLRPALRRHLRFSRPRG